MFIQKVEMLETAAIDLVAKVAPWAAPLPTAYLVGRATVIHLAWPVLIGVVAAVVVETLGLASASTALDLRQYNVEKRKTDPRAPFWLAAMLVLIYFIVATGLTIALDIHPSLAKYAPAIFPTLSLTGVTVLALRGDHKRRLASIAKDKADRRAARRARQQTHDSQVSSSLSSGSNIDMALDRMQAGRKARLKARLDALVEVLSEDPDIAVADAARKLNVSRQTIYTYLGRLEGSGRIRRNGQGLEVLSRV